MLTENLFRNIKAGIHELLVNIAYAVAHGFSDQPFSWTNMVLKLSGRILLSL